MRLENIDLPEEFCSECNCSLDYKENTETSGGFIDSITIDAQCPNCHAEFELEIHIEFEMLKMSKK